MQVSVSLSIGLGITRVLDEYRGTSLIRNRLGPTPQQVSVSLSIGLGIA